MEQKFQKYTVNANAVGKYYILSFDVPTHVTLNNNKNKTKQKSLLRSWKKR